MGWRLMTKMRKCIKILFKLKQFEGKTKKQQKHGNWGWIQDIANRGFPNARPRAAGDDIIAWAGSQAVPKEKAPPALAGGAWNDSNSN